MATRRDDTREPWRARAVWIALFALVSLVHLYFVPYFPVLNNPNENSRVYQIRALVELRKLSVDEQIARYGMVNDLARKDGKFYTGKAPGTTFLGAPVYWGLKTALRALHKPEATPFQLLLALRLGTATLPTLLFLYLFRGFLRRVTGDSHLSNALSLLLGLGTMMLPYALLFVNHSTSAAAAFGAVIAADASMRARGARPGPARQSTAGWGWLVVSGFLGAFCVALDYALAPVAAMVLAVMLWRVRPAWPGVLALGFGAGIPAVMTGIYHQICWGGPFRVSMSYLANPEFANNADKGVFGIIGPTRESLWGLLLGAQKGLLFFSPVFAIGLPAVILAAVLSRRSKEAVLSLAVTLWMLLYGVSLVNWDAGWTVGPRYVTVIVPFVVFGIALFLSELRPSTRALVVPVVIGLGIAGVIATVSTSVLFPHLQPDFVNPLFECIWPLWKDGITPKSVGRWLFHWQGRVDQVPVVAAVTLLLGYLVAVVAGACKRGRWAWPKAIAGAVATLAVAVAVLGVMRLPKTEDAKRVAAANAWLRNVVWEPRLGPPVVRKPFGPLRR